MTDADREEVQEWIRSQRMMHTWLTSFTVSFEFYQKLYAYIAERNDNLGESLTTYGYEMRLWGKPVVIQKDADHAAFLAAIIARPDDDLPRLIYADYLDERDGGVPCGACVNGDSIVTAFKKCLRCAGTGCLPNPRAEFIRVQCELANHPLGGDELGVTPPGCFCKAKDPRKLIKPFTRCQVCCDAYDSFQALRRRESELLKSPCFLWELPIQWDRTGMPWQYRRGFVEEIACSWQDWRQHADAIRASTPLKKVKLTTRPPDGSGFFMGSLFPDKPGFVNYAYPGIEFELPQPRQTPIEWVDSLPHDSTNPIYAER